LSRLSAAAAKKETGALDSFLGRKEQKIGESNVSLKEGSQGNCLIQFGWEKGLHEQR